MDLRPWEAEIDADEVLAHLLIESQFPDLAPARLHPFAVGWDNTAWLVNDVWIFRIPRREIAVPSMQTEINLLPFLATRLPLPIPDPVFLGRPDHGFPWPFAGYCKIPGRSADALDLDVVSRTRSAGPLARFLRVLHDVPVHEARAYRAPDDRFRRLDIAFRLPRARKRLEHLQSLGFIHDLRPFAAVIDAVATLDDHVRADTLVHGDLYARHLLVHDDGTPTGIVDWGDVHVGDSASDLAVLWSYLPPEARPVFLDIYGPVSEETLALARFRALLTTLWLLAYGHDVEDEDVLSEGRKALQHIAAT